MIWLVPNVMAVEDPFEIQVIDGQLEVGHPYRLISGKHYRLQAVTSDNRVLAAQWFLAGNLGRITLGNRPTLTAVFVGIGDLICRVESVEQRIRLSVVPATLVIGRGGGNLESPAGVKITLRKDTFAMEQQIGIQIVASPGLPLAAHRFVRVIQISPERLVLKRSAQLTFFFGDNRFPDITPEIYFWEVFSEKWIPLRGRVNMRQNSVNTPINHFGIYSLMTSIPEDLKRTRRLQIQNVNLSPRVFFAPDIHRLTIAYQLNADLDTMQAFVTMDIFDLRGRRVRRLFENAPHYIGPNVAQWDGLTDDGALIRNGRYLLVILARMGAQQTAHQKLIIVFK